MLRHEQRLEICETCGNRRKDTDNRLICGLTLLPPDFAYTCEDYTQDTSRLNHELFDTLESSHEPSIKRAGTGLRFINFVIDGVAITIIARLLSVNYHFFHNPFSTPLLQILLDYLIIVVYYSLFELATFKTLGKIITSTKVVTTEGKRPTSEQIVIRSLSRLIPFNALSFLFTDGNGWHDQISKTIVVPKDFNEELEDDTILDRF